MKKIEIECCEGSQKYRNQCLADRCPLYKKSTDEIDRWWPYLGTGFGNLYGYPTHADYLSGVRKQLKMDCKEEPKGS